MITVGVANLVEMVMFRVRVNESCFMSVHILTKIDLQTCVFVCLQPGWKLLSVLIPSGGKSQLICLPLSSV